MRWCIEEERMITIEKNKINGKKLKWGGTMFVTEEDYECLYDNAKGYKSYVEIGSMWGSSAIVAGYAVSGEVHCIDPFKGRAQLKHVVDNWEQHHDIERLTIHKQKNPPFPVSIEARKFDVGLIDGDHDVPAVWKDWFALKDRINHIILFHDVHYRGVPRIDSDAERHVTGVFNKIARTDPDWELVEVRGKMGVLKRK